MYHTPYILFIFSLEEFEYFANIVVSFPKERQSYLKENWYIYIYKSKPDKRGT